jgi:Protein of unknown function (DUF4013)
MTYPNAPNPYASPIAPPPAPAKEVVGGTGQTAMQYMRAYHFIFENPNWTTTVAYIGLCTLAAIIPGVSILLQLLFLGYQFETIELLLRTRGTQYPDFSFGRIGDYLGRGIWPFLLNLIVSVVLVPIIYIAVIIMIVVVALLAHAAGDQAGPVIAVIGGIFGFAIFLGLMLSIMMLVAPMLLRCGLAQDFGAAFQFSWISDFVRKMYREMVLAGLFMMGTALPLALAGILACGIGICVVTPIILLAQTHLLYQLYGIYLTRGGQPVPMKVAAMPMMPPGYAPPR